MRHIMVATDGSSSADRAVDFAAQLAKATGAALHILTIGGLSGLATRRLAQAEGHAGDSLEALAIQTLMQARGRVQRVGVVAIEVETGWGDPAEAIIETAQHKGTDVIVIGRRGHGRLAGLLLGSVSQKLVSLAPCAVVVVP